MMRARSPAIIHFVLLGAAVRALAPAELLWSQTTEGFFYTSVAFAEGGTAGQPNILSAQGWWESLPWTFWVAAAPALAPNSTLFNVSITPGGLVPTAGTSSIVAYNGIDFNTYAADYALYNSSGEGWRESLEPGSTDNVWQTGPAMQLSGDGSRLAIGMTIVASESNTQSKYVNFSVLQLPSGAGGAPQTLLNYVGPNTTAFQALHLSADGELAFLVNAWQPDSGTINSSSVTVFSVSQARTVLELSTYYVFASCASVSGSYMVATTSMPPEYGGQQRILAFARTGDPVNPLLVVADSVYPAVPGSFDDGYIATCRVTDSGMLIATRSLCWGNYINQTAVMGIQLPAPPSAEQLAAAAAAGQPWQPLRDLQASWIWLSDPVDPSLQDTPVMDSLSPDGSVYGYVSWGGTPLNASSPQPPTLFLLPTAPAPAALEAVEGSTPYSTPVVAAAMGALPNIPFFTAATVGSLEALDLTPAPSKLNATSAASFYVVASGIGAHANIGSNTALQYLWQVDVPAN